MANQIELPQGLSTPTALQQMRELALPLDLLGFALRGPLLFGAPRGDGRPVILIPGYGGSELSMRPLERYLRRLGYDVHDWALGRNRGEVDRDVTRFTGVAGEISTTHADAPVTLIGWSLGGIIAREVARLAPSLVREVITMGTPVIGGPKYTAPGARFARTNSVNLDAFEVEVHERNSIGIGQPLTVIYSDSDGIVGSDIAIDRYNKQARNIRVDGGHLGLGFNPRVWRIIADTLARQADPSEN